MIDLEEGQLAEVLRILQQQAPECEVRAYGSRVTGRAKRYSDLDLAVLAPEGAMDWRRLARLKEAFSLSDLPIMVDVSDWASLDDSFRRVILARYEVIQPMPVPPETRRGEKTVSPLGEAVPHPAPLPEGEGENN